MHESADHMGRYFKSTRKASENTSIRMKCYPHIVRLVNELFIGHWTFFHNSKTKNSSFRNNSAIHLKIQLQLHTSVLERSIRGNIECLGNAEILKKNKKYNMYIYIYCGEVHHITRTAAVLTIFIAS